MLKHIRPETPRSKELNAGEILNYRRGWYANRYDPWRYILIRELEKEELAVIHTTEKIADRLLFPREMLVIINDLRRPTTRPGLVWDLNIDTAALSYEISRLIYKILFDDVLDDLQNTWKIDLYLNTHDDDLILKIKDGAGSVRGRV